MVRLSELRRKYKEKYGSITEIDLIITNVLNIDKSRLFMDISVNDEELSEIESKILRLTKNEPVEYIIGHKEFMSLDFKVNPSTLIPRADTEILVEEIIRLCGDKPVNIFEIGTGSGCIAISLAHYIENANIIACDISEKALETAKENALLNGVESRIKFIRHDILSGFPDLDFIPDVIVSNPPYIESDVVGTLDDKVKDFEPLSALDGGADGLIFYRSIIQNALLQKDGVLAFEIGYNQGISVADLMKENYTDIEIIKDLADNDRVVKGKKK